LFFAGLVIGSVFLLVGCEEELGFAGSETRFVLGGLEADLNENVATVYQAALAAVIELDLPIKDKRSDALRSIVKSRDAGGNDITIDIRSTGTAQCRLNIRVGLLGDKAKSQTIYEYILQNI